MEAIMSGLTSLVKRYPLATFFAISIATFFAGGVMAAQNPESQMWVFTIYGTALGALFVVGLSEGRAGVKAWASRIVRGRVGLKWYAVVLGLPIAWRLAAFGINLALGAAAQPFPWEALSELPIEFVLVFLVTALGEEAGFRGYALPKLMEKYSPLTATLILGVVRVIWHLPLVINGMDPVWVLPVVLAGDFVFTWIFRNTRGSVLMAMLLHTVVNTSGDIFNPLFSGAAADRQFVIYGAMVVMTAIVITIAAWRDFTNQPVPQHVDGATAAQSLALEG
jgi:membrane protease YdiL (CAAX protease family)